MAFQGSFLFVYLLTGACKYVTIAARRFECATSGRDTAPRGAVSAMRTCEGVPIMQGTSVTNVEGLIMEDGSWLYLSLQQLRLATDLVELLSQAMPSCCSRIWPSTALGTPGMMEAVESLRLCCCFLRISLGSAASTTGQPEGVRGRQEEHRKEF
jgi:hypothetical protein